MQRWSRTPVLTLAVILVVLTGCARERTGDVHEGPAGSDAVKVVLHDDAFLTDALNLDAGLRWMFSEVRTRGATGTTSRSTRWTCRPGTIEPGHVMTATFVVPNGTMEYHCTFHPGMRGEIVAE